MHISHTEIVGRLLGADPHHAAARFRTIFQDGDIGETGSLLYASRDRWIVDTDHGGRVLHTPTETRHEHEDGSQNTVAGPSSPSFTSPIALLLPRYGAIHGRPEDDWIIDDRAPIHTDEDDQLIVTFRSMEDPNYTATARIHPTEYCITSFTTPTETSELIELRFDVTEEEAELMRDRG